MYSCTFSGWVGGFCVLCWYECLVILARDLFIRHCDHINDLSLILVDSGSVDAFAVETYLVFHFITYVCELILNVHKDLCLSANGTRCGCKRYFNIAKYDKIFHRYIFLFQIRTCIVRLAFIFYYLSLSLCVSPSEIV